MSSVRPYIGECLGFKGAAYYYANLGLPDKGFVVTFVIVNKIWLGL